MSVFLEVIEAADAESSELIRRVPEQGSADIKMGAVCVVQESQVAVFLRDGKVLDVLGPGRHVLSTGNLPLLSELFKIPYGGKSPFRASVYFVNQKVFTGMRWGTRQPVAFRDKELGVVRLRGYGVYAMRISDPTVFLNTLTGTQNVMNSGDVEEYLKDVIVSRLNDILGERLSGILDLPALYNELATEVRLELKDDFARFGIDLIDFFITSVTPTEEVQKALDERAGINAVGPMQPYLQYQAGKALGRGEGGGNGEAAQGLGLGVGAGMGLVLPQAFLGRHGAAGPGAAAAGPAFCPHCGGDLNAVNACVGCSHALPPGSAFCPKCGVEQKQAENG